MTELLADDDIEVVAVPIDAEDDKAKLEKYVTKWKPAYRMLIDLPIEERAEVTSFLAEQTRTENPPLPHRVRSRSSTGRACAAHLPASLLGSRRTQLRVESSLQVGP